MSVVVLREIELSVEAMTGLVTSASREGHRSLQRLLEAWARGGAYRGRGELILAAWERSVIIGVIAIERVDDETGRVSALYVAPADRRRGIGRELLRRASEMARRSFGALELRAGRAAEPFLESVGFTRVVGAPQVSHRRALR